MAAGRCGLEPAPASDQGGSRRRRDGLGAPHVVVLPLGIAFPLASGLTPAARHLQRLGMPCLAAIMPQAATFRGRQPEGA